MGPGLALKHPARRSIAASAIPAFVLPLHSCGSSANSATPPPRYRPRPMRGAFNKVPRRAAASQRVNRGRRWDVRIEAGLVSRDANPQNRYRLRSREAVRDPSTSFALLTLRMTIGADRAGKSAITFTINFQLRTLILEAVLAGHLNESAFAKIFFAPRALGPAYPNERLQFILADGRDQSSIGCELL